MKRKILVVCAFIFAVTTGILQAIPSNSNPTMSRVYGNQFTPQVPDTQSAAVIGTLDTNFNTIGSLSINSILSGGQAWGLQTLSNGNFLAVVSKSGSASKVALFNAEGSSIVTPLDLGTSSVVQPLATMLDTQGRLLVAGGANSGSAGWIYRVNTAVTSASAFTTGSAWQHIAGLAQQSLLTDAGKIIAVGYNGTNAQIGRYNVDGTLDTTSSFGTAGLVALDGSGTLPTVETGLFSVVVDANDNIYVAFVASATANGFTSNNAYIARFTSAGALDTSWNGTGFAALTALNSATSGLSVAVNNDGSFIVGAQVSSNILVTGVTSSGGAIGGFTTFDSSIIADSSFTITNLLTTSDDSIFIVGSDTATSQMAVIRLLGTTGVLDTAFNGTGYNVFYIAGASPRTQSFIEVAAVAVDGQLYTAGYQINAGVTVPYVSRLNNTPYVSQVAQFPAAIQEQGILDQTFGNPSRQTFSGVTNMFNGLYGPSMMQMANAAVEATVVSGPIPQGDILVGMNGFGNNSNQSSMMFACLTSEGIVDTSFNSTGTPGYLTLDNLTTSNETLVAMLEDGAGAIYIAGTSDTQGAFVRAYSSFTSSTPFSYTASIASTDAVGLSFQGITAPATDFRVLLCVTDTTTQLTGSIYGYNNSAALDHTFGDGGSGSISPNSFGLHMGPSYGLVVSKATAEAFIYAAYLDTTTPTSLGVCVAKFQENGSGLIPEFATAGVAQNIFAAYDVDKNNIRIGLLADGNLIVAAVTATQILVAFLDPVTGSTVPATGFSQALTALGVTSLDLTRVTGVSDGTAIVTFWGATSTPDKSMYIARVLADGTGIDPTFNSQGSLPGVLPIQIGDKVSNYNARSATCAIIQSTAGDYQGNIAVVGYESVTANDATPMAMRVYGAPGTTEVIDFPVNVIEPGTFDMAYDLQSLLGFGFGKVIFNYPFADTFSNSRKMLVGIDTGTSTIVARVDQTMVLDTSFNSAGTGNPGSARGYVTIASNNGVNHVSIDKQDNILVGGSSGGTVGWATLINNAGSAQTQFTMPTSPSIAAVNNIGQQESGRYIVAATETGGKGMLIAFQDKLTPASPTAFAVDPTFNPLGFGSATPGSFYVASSGGLYAMAINTTYVAPSPGPLCNIDTIVVAYSAGNVAQIAEVTADGSGFAIVAFGATGVLADNSSAVQVNIDGSQNIVVGASRNTGGTSNVYVARYNSAGTLDTSFGTSGLTTLPFTGSSSVTLTGLMETTVQQTVLIGYNTPSISGPQANGPLFAARLVADGGLDTIWNTSPAGSDYAGLLTYNSSDNSSGIAAAINVTGSAIASPGGNIYSIGSTTGTAMTSDAIVTVVFGDNGVTQISQNPLESAAGTLDNTIPGNTSGLGALPLSGLVTGVPQKIYIYNQTVNSSPNGAMLIASVAADQYAYITQLNADLSINTNFATGTGNIATINLGSGNAPTITDMYVATGNTNSAQQYIYVTGYTLHGSTRTMFAARILPDGSGTPTLAAASNFITTDGDFVAGCIRQSSNGRVLVSGYNESGGSVVAYNSAMNTIDTSFGNNNNSAPLYGAGYYTTTTANPIVAMTTDSSDRIYIAYLASAGVVNVDRLLENGTELDVAFNGTGRVTLTGTTFSSTQIKLAIDLVNNQIIVVGQDGAGSGNTLKVARFSTIDGSPTGTLYSTPDVSIPGSVLTLSDLFIDNNYTGSAYPNIYVVGYVSSGTGSGNSVVARIATTASSIALDTTYGASGIANLSEGAMTVVTAAALDPDRRVYLVGSNGGATSGYMGRFFGDYYWTESYPAIAQGVVGTLDVTLNPDGTQGGVNLSDASVTSAAWNTALANGYQARAIIENPNGDGSSYIAFGNGISLIVGQVDADMVPVTGFGGLSTGLTDPALVAMTSVNTIAIDAAGNVVVAGTNSGAQQVALFNSSGILQATFSAPTVASTLGTTVAQQKSGRYIVGGYDGSANGLVSAYKNTSAIASPGIGGILPVDLTFGPNGSNGYYPTGINAQVDDLVIDSNDYIYIVYRNSGTVNVAKLTPEGSLSTSANTPSAQVWPTNPILATGILSATQPARIAINQAGNLLIGASTNTGTADVKIARVTGPLGVVTSAVVVNTANSPVLTKLVGSITSQNEFYGCMYNTSSTKASVFGISSAGAVDFVAAYTGVQSVIQVTGLSVQYDGKIVAVGYNLAGTSFTADPVLVRFYGYPYYSQFAQAPDQVAAGILDTTLWPTSGALELDNYSPISTTITTLGGSQVSRIYEYPAGDANNGKALLVFTNTNSGADTVLARVNKDLTLDTTFNSAYGFITITGNNNATSLFVDSNANIYVAGGTGASWIRAYDNSGTVLSGWLAPASYLANGAYQVGVQSVGRTILAGKATNGTLVAYNTSGVLDATFGVAGTVDMGTTDAITDFAIDLHDTIITVKTTSGSTVLQRVSASGLILTSLTTANASPIINAIGNAKVVLDEAGHIVVASATTTGFTIARYTNDALGTVNGTQITISVGTSSAFLGNIYATSDGKVTLVGSEPTAGIVVARLTSDFALDTDTFNATTGYLIINDGFVNVVNDGMICADDRIMVAGTNQATPEPYLARVFGDTYVTYVSQAPVQGVAGTINPTFGTGGVYDDSTLNGVLVGAQGKAIFPLADGGYYQAFDNANSADNSILIKTIADGSLDTTYNTGATAGIAGHSSPTYAPLGVQSILQDGSDNVLLVGTHSDAGWLQRYTSAGVIDTTFNGTGVVNLAASTEATVAVEQTLGRYVVAGSNIYGAALFAYESLAPNGTPGTVDTTFNAGAGGTPGYVQIIDSTNTIWNLVADQYDRLIFAVLNSAGNAVDLYRLTPTGELDVTFGTNGKFANAITSATGASSVRVALDAAGNIIVAANSSTSNTFSVRAFDNGVSSELSGNGSFVPGWNSNTQLNINSLTAPSVTAVTTSADGYALILGNQSAGTDAAWIARITPSATSDSYSGQLGVLDTDGFDPLAVTGIAGIFQYLQGGSTAHLYYGLAVNTNGTLGMLGYEDISGTDTPTLVSVYDDPYTSQESQTPDSRAVGSIDPTLGVGVMSSAVTAVADGIVYYAAGGDSSSLQVAEAVALYDDNNIVVAIDGANSTSSGASRIMINMFDNDGLLYNQTPAFGTAGTATVLPNTSAYAYQNQYVRDMVTFTAGGVTKAILAGYVTNSALPGANQNSSLLLQYILTPGSNGLDSSFGGFDENPAGIAFGDGKQAFVVGQQSTGRIVVGGLSQDNLGLLLGYTAAGKLDTSFANDGYQSGGVDNITGQTGIYSHAIDNQNRVVIVYNSGTGAGTGTVEVARMLADGSGLDTSFATPTPLIATVTSSSNMKVAVDSANDVIVAAVTNSGHNIAVYSYAVGGGTATNQSGISGAGITGAQLGNASAVYTLARVIVDAANNVIVVAYDTNANKTLIMRLVASSGNYILDTTFNGTGYITYQVAGGGSSQVATDAMVHPDGRIIVVGSENEAI